MKRRSLPLSISRFPQSLRDNLNGYAVGAAAAGVALLSLAPAPADAEIVYTPANIRITPGDEIALDLNHDGIVDFDLVNNCYASVPGCILTVSPKTVDNGIFVDGEVNGSSEAVALSKGIPIGQAEDFNQSSALMAYAYSHHSGGHWANVADKYLGLRVHINGEFHYAWVRLTVGITPDKQEVGAQLTGFAYETVANLPIRAGQTSGSSADASNTQTPNPSIGGQLGLLALGERGLAGWRRETED